MGPVYIIMNCNISWFQHLLFIKNYRDEAIIDQRHLEFLAEISSRNIGIKINEPSVTEPLERDPETIAESK